MIEDYKSPKELAQYLQFLDQNDAEYNKYLKWKTTGVTNQYLRNEIEQRTWSITETWKPGKTNFIEEFECFVCERVHENLKLTSRGKPEVKYIADKSHLECPAPKPFFSSSFRSMDWVNEYRFLDDEAEVLRYFTDKNLPITSGDYHAKLSEVRSKRSRWF